MPRNVKIIVKRGATIIELTSGRAIPEMRTVAYEIPTLGQLHKADPRDPDTKDVYEFRFGNKIWTVNVDEVEVVA